MLRREADRLKQLETVGVERDVEDENVRRERGQLGTHLAHRARPAHLVTHAAEALNDRLRQPGLVLGEQDAGHRRAIVASGHYTLSLA